MSDIESGSEDEAAIRRLIEDWAAAVRRRDLDAILRRHSPDMLLFDVPPPFQSRGLAAYARSWELFFSWSADPTPFDIVEMTITAGADVAFAAAAMRCAEPGPGGEPKPLDFRLTLGLRKTGGQWTITHEHHSIPATD